MGGIFSYDSKFTLALHKFADLIIASALWIVGCLPLLTIGTSTTALYYASIKAVLGEGTIVKNFFKSYKENLKQSIVVEIILLIVAYIMYVNWKIVFDMAGGGTVFKVVYFVVLLWLVPIVCYIFPLLARFAFSTKMLFVNAFVLSFQNLPKTIFIVLTSMLPIVCLVVRLEYVIKLLPLIVVAAPGLIAFLNATMFIKVFEPYMPKEEAEAEREED